jgi:hypothetical protein
LDPTSLADSLRALRSLDPAAPTGVDEAWVRIMVVDVIRELLELEYAMFGYTIVFDGYGKLPLGNRRLPRQRRGSIWSGGVSIGNHPSVRLDGWN